MLFDEVVAAGSWLGGTDIMAFDLRPGATANFEITSSTFESMPLDEADRETAFGVQVDQSSLQASSGGDRRARGADRS